MESLQFSSLSSLRGEFKSENYIEPHYKESYRLAIDHLVKGGRDCYQEFLIEERIGNFLSEQELLFITANAEPLPPQNPAEEINSPTDTQSSSGTYWPMHSDVDTPDLDLGWPEFMHEQMQTNIDLLFHPPRQNNPTIKEVIRKCIRDARQVVAIVMDTFTDVDIFKETVDASIRGVPVYVLLADSHLKSFLTMVENQDVKIQQLRNMRVRTVKGQDYLCGSGAKFHGAMEQRFLVVDCHTAIYGSYSLTWSFEKINLSMVQVITGHLVKSYDEEFRTLYARSTVPAELCPPEGFFQGNGPQGLQIFQNSTFHSAQKIDQRDQLRITLDRVYRKTCERKLDAGDLEESLLEEEFNKLGPMVENGIGVQNQMLQFQSAEMANYLKRHSYAGERQSGYMPQGIRPRASNWNICRDTVNGTYNYPKDNYLQMPQMYRGQNMCQSNNDNGKILSMQQNTQTLDCASKSFMRTWRIESYFNNPDIPYEESSDYLDQFEPQDKASSFMQGKIRSSLAFRSTIPEQMEPNSHINNMWTGVGASAAPNTPLHCSSKQWNPTAAAENGINNEEFMLKRQSLVLNDTWNDTSVSPGRNLHHSVYTSGRNKSGQMITNPDILIDNWHKRHSVADPRSDWQSDQNEYSHGSSNRMYGAFPRMPAGINRQNGGYVSNLNEDHRSVSHFDVKNIRETTGPTTRDWELPSRTASAAALAVNSRHLTGKSNNMGSQHFLKKSSKKIKSLLNITEKKEYSVRGVKTPSLQSKSSADTLTGQYEERISDEEEKRHQSATNPVRSSSALQRNLLLDDLKYSKPRFRTEENQQPLQSPPPTETTQQNLAAGETSSSSGENLNLPKGEAAIEHNLTRIARGPYETRLERFIHKMGNLIHKNK
ncbi:hypothetical protein PAMA_002532 [Pampus argenteus]